MRGSLAKACAAAAKANSDARGKRAAILRDFTNVDALVDEICYDRCGCIVTDIQMADITGCIQTYFSRLMERCVPLIDGISDKNIFELRILAGGHQYVFGTIYRKVGKPCECGFSSYPFKLLCFCIVNIAVYSASIDISFSAEV